MLYFDSIVFICVDITYLCRIFDLFYNFHCFVWAQPYLLKSRSSLVLNEICGAHLGAVGGIWVLDAIFVLESADCISSNKFDNYTVTMPWTLFHL